MILIMKLSEISYSVSLLVYETHFDKWQYYELSPATFFLAVILCDVLLITHMLLC